MTTTNKSNGAKFGIILFFNVMLIMIIVGNISTSRVSSVLSKYGSDWPEVAVTIDDVSFEYCSSDTDDGKTTYYYELHRILHYTYNGTEYEVNDTEKISSSDIDYKMELRRGYTDKYKYQINPENPKAVSKSYSIFDDEKAFQSFYKIFTMIPIAILVILDVTVVMIEFSRKKRIFDKEFKSDEQKGRLS